MGTIGNFDDDDGDDDDDDEDDIILMTASMISTVAEPGRQWQVLGSHILTRTGSH